MKEYKHSNFEIKSLSEEETKWTFKGYASIFDIPDRYNDIVMKGAFKRTIDHHKGNFPLVFMHDPNQMIGGVRASEDRKGLQVDGFLLKGIPRANEVHELMKAGVIDGMSFAFKTIQRSFKGKHRLLKEVQLGEVTVGPRSMVVHPSTEITEVKSLFEEYNKDLRKILSLPDRQELDIKGDISLDENLIHMLKEQNKEIKRILKGV